MGSLKALTLAGGVAIVAATAAKAADLPPPPPPEPAPVYAPAPDFGGWYIRGDVGVGWNKEPKLRMNPIPEVGSDYCDGGGCYSNASGSYKFHNPDVSQSTFVGLGIGYAFNQWLRADATLEWRGGAHLSATDQLLRNDDYVHNSDAGASGRRSTALRNFYRGQVSSIVGLVNGYIDLGTFYGFTPYIGAGVGFANNYLRGLTDQGYFSYNVDNAYGTSGSSPTGGLFKNGRKTNFAWALMAGVSYSVTSNLKLEIGYRYLNLGKVTSGDAQCFNSGGGDGFTACGQNGVPWRLSTKNLESHDIRVGMRWMIGAAPAPAPEPYFPVVRSKF